MKTVGSHRLRTLEKNAALSSTPKRPGMHDSN